jgi:plasmid maintenance system antidote protein VapI
MASTIDVPRERIRDLVSRAPALSEETANRLHALLRIPVQRDSEARDGRA